MGSLLGRLRARRWTAWQVALVGASTVGLPLLIAAVALHRRHYFPVLDLAMTEFRVRDVGGGHTPLIGLPGRIGKFPAQGSHPGPLSFYLLAPVYRLLGSSAWSLLVSAMVLNVAAFSATVALAFRKGGWRLTAGVALWLAIVVRGYGITVLTQPWNPYLPLAMWTLVLLAAWMVADGDHLMLVPLVVAGTYCAQTHVPYLVLCVGLFVVAVAVTLRRSGWSASRGSLLWSSAIGVVLWLPPLLDQVSHSPGNIRMLQEHFSTPTEPSIGVGEGLRLMLRHLDIVKALFAQHGTGGFVAAASETNRNPLVGGIVVVAWIGAMAIAVRMRHRWLLGVHGTLACAVVLQTLSMVRIFGKVWYYLTLWAWSVTVAIVIATVVTYAIAWGRGRPERGSLAARTGWALGTAVGVTCTVISIGGAVSAQVPEPRLSEGLGALVGPTVRAITERDGAATAGRDGKYLVTWTDAFSFGSQGYGLVNELERAGLHVGVDRPFAVPVTFHRVLDRSAATAEIHFASGVYIDQWKAKPDQLEIVEFDPLSPAERATFDSLHQQLVAGLRAAHLDDLVVTLDVNLFGLTIDGRVPATLRPLISRMLDLGEPVAVFLGPAPKG